MNGHFALSVYAFPATAFMLPRLASSSTYQRMLIGTLALVVRRRRMVEQSRYLKGLRDRWVAADIDQMRVRMQSIAVQRYVPGA